MVQSQFRKSDERAADAVAQFLDERFYTECSDVERVMDKARQVRGLDIIFTYNGRKYLCDEKAAVQYANKRLGTFALELTMIDRGGYEHIGWFLDGTKTNDSFLFIWVDSISGTSVKSKDDINEVEIALIRKDEIMKFLASKGWTPALLLRKANRIRTVKNENLGSIPQYGYKFSYSTQLVEKPINLLLTREVYRKLSDYTAIIKK
jgi:hypothetical protein